MNENFKLYQGDCLDVLEKLAEQGTKVDAIITDPPFFMPAEHYQSGQSKWGRTYSDGSVLGGWYKTVTSKAMNVLADTGHYLTFCNAESYPVFYQAQYGYFHKIKLLVWDKTRSIPWGRIWRPQHELIMASRNKGHKYIRNDGKRSDILCHPITSPAKRNHPVQKPVSLLEELILATTEEGDTVLDMFAGSGTTGIAALKHNRKFIGIEMDEKYYQVAKQNIAQSLP